MQRFTTPEIDDQNPLYCPSITAHAYLDTLRRHRQEQRTEKPKPKATKSKRQNRTFGQLLEQAMNEDSPGGYDSDTMHTIGTDSCNSSDSPGLAFPYQVPSWELRRSPPNSRSPSFDLSDKHISGQKLKRKRSTFSDLLGSPKYAKSVQSVHDSSFDVSVRHEKLNYSFNPEDETMLNVDPMPKRGALADDVASTNLALRVRLLEGLSLLYLAAWTCMPAYMRIEELYGPSVGTETPRGLRVLIRRLDALLPGIRLRERLLVLPNLTHQTIADFLGINGHLNERVLSILRTSEIRNLSLSTSLSDEAGLNLMGLSILSVFSKPNSFLFLSYLDFGDVPLEDEQLMHIHHLPRLSKLILDNTNVGNEAMYHLVPLKRSLLFLSIATNPRITNDSIFALTTFSRLEFLNIFDTEVDMTGVRQFARNMAEQNRMTDLVLPQICEEYFDNITLQYLLEPALPLITDPELCGRLSAAALKRNLAAHAAVNSSIIASGTKAEMAERLRNLLMIRRDDLLIQERCA